MISYLLSGEYLSAFICLLSGIVVVFWAQPIHEAAHAWMAHRLGDETPKYQGRLTVNPLVHIDPIGGLMIVLFGFGWAKPVPVNMRNFKHPKQGMALTALAGPVSNLVVSFFFLVMQYAILATGALNENAVVFAGVQLFLNQIVMINLSLAVFNLLPIPPLDGSRLLNAFLPDRLYYRIMQYERYIMMVVMILIVTGALSTPLSFLVGKVYSALNVLAKLPFRWILG